MVGVLISCCSDVSVSFLLGFLPLPFLLLMLSMSGGDAFGKMALLKRVDFHVYSPNGRSVVTVVRIPEVGSVTVPCSR